MQTKKVTYSQAIAEALNEEMARDLKVIVLGEDIGPQGGVFGTTRGLFDKYGCDRVLDTPISENSLVNSIKICKLVNTNRTVKIVEITVRPKYFCKILIF